MFKYLFLLFTLASFQALASVNEGDNQSIYIKPVSISYSAYNTTATPERPYDIERFYINLPENYTFNSRGGDMGFDEDIGGYNVTTNNQVDYCFNSPVSYCRKAMVSFLQEYQTHQAYFMLSEAGSFEDWIIIFQDWVRIKPEDANGNHPITTIKLIKESGKYYLVHYENSWQWDDSNYEPNDPYDELHTHPNMENELGRVEIEIGKHYKLDLTIDRSGYSALFVNNVQVSSAYYQTKSPTEQHVYMWGAYWNYTSVGATPTKFNLYNFGY